MKKIHESKNSKKFNATVNKVHEEMESAQRTANNWNVKWKETYSDVYCYDLQFLLEDDVASLESKYDCMYDLSRYYDDSKREGQAIERVTLEDYNGEEYVCEFRKVDWLLSNSRVVRSFTFGNKGDIVYSQIRRKRVVEDKAYDYYASYDVIDNDLSLRVVNPDDDICFINSSLRQYKFDNKSMAEDEEKITIIERKDDTNSLEVNLDRSGKVLRRYLTQGEYQYILEGNDLVGAFYNGVELERNLETWIMVTYAIDSYEIGKMNDEQLFEYINLIKSKVINAIKSIKGDVPMDGLSRRLDIALSMISTKRIVPVEENIGLRKNK